jgi:hypothetical protein
MISLFKILSCFLELRTLAPSAHKVNETISMVDSTVGIFRESVVNCNGVTTYNNHIIAEHFRDDFQQH